MADPITSHPAVLVATALIGAGAWKTVDKAVSAWAARQRQRRIDAGEPDPRNLQGWLINEVKILRGDIATLRVESRQQLDVANERNRQLADEHNECRRNLAAMQVEIDHLQAEVAELRTELDATKSELATERNGRRRPAKGATS